MKILFLCVHMYACAHVGINMWVCIFLCVFVFVQPYVRNVSCYKITRTLYILCSLKKYYHADLFLPFRFCLDVRDSPGLKQSYICERE